MKSSKKMLILIGLLIFVALLCIATQSPEAALIGSLPLVFGTTLAANKPRTAEIGDINEFAVIASDIIYEGAAVGIVKASGHARPLTSSDKFAGFAEAKADNSAGAAAAINVRVKKRGMVQLSVSGAVISDIGQPIYATDDDTFVFLPTGGVFIGFVRRFVSSGVAIVEYDAENFVDPYAGKVAGTISVDTTLDATYSGKVLFVDTDAKVITLPAVEGIGGIKIVNIGSYGTIAVNVSPNAVDMIEGPGITAADNKDIINTKATAQRGDFIELEYGDANGWTITDMKGTWAREA